MPGPKSDKVWSDAIRKAVHNYHEEKDAAGKVKKVRYLNLLADNLVKAGAAGDIQAMKEIGDRLDGKPAQAMTHGNADGSNLNFGVVMVDAKSKDT